MSLGTPSPKVVGGSTYAGTSAGKRMFSSSSCDDSLHTDRRHLAASGDMDKSDGARHRAYHTGASMIRAAGIFLLAFRLAPLAYELTPFGDRSVVGTRYYCWLLWPRSNTTAWRSLDWPERIPTLLDLMSLVEMSGKRPSGHAFSAVRTCVRKNVSSEMLRQR